MIKKNSNYSLERSRIDSHKLSFHIPRVYDWYCGKDIFPIYLEIGLSGLCNQRCIFCAFDYLDRKKNFLIPAAAKRFLKEISDYGIKSILYSGEGEPLLNKDAGKIIEFTRKIGIDAALSTNGVLFNSSNAERTLPSLSWLRISLNSATRKNYALIHGTDEKNFDIVINNIANAVRVRNRIKSKCVINVQFLLIPDNYGELGKITKVIAETGADNLIIKPYLQHPLSINKLSIGYSDIKIKRIIDQIDRFKNNKLKVFLRVRALEKLTESKPYDNCFGFSFASHITAEGNVYPCNAFVGNDRFSFGNINKNSFKKIWFGNKRKYVMRLIYKDYDIRKCRTSCRLDEINRYLWELRNPGFHVNFI